MDFGFASLLDKFEEHYGRRAGKALVGLIGIAVAAVCIGLIWGFVGPLIAWINDTAAGQSIWAWAARFFGFAAAGCILVAAGAAFSTLLEARKLIRMSADLMDDSVQTIERAESLLFATRSVLEELHKKLGGDGTAAAPLDEVIKMAANTKTRAKKSLRLLKQMSKQ